MKFKGGARRRIRTADTAIFSRMLYQLSYPGILDNLLKRGGYRLVNGPMANAARFGKSLIIVACNIFRIGWWYRDGIAFVKPLGEVAIAAA